MQQDEEYAKQQLGINQNLLRKELSEFNIQDENVDEVMCMLNELQGIDFADELEFNDKLLKVANKIKDISGSHGLTNTDEEKLNDIGRNIMGLTSQDVSGGHLAREITRIFLNDMNENSRGQMYPQMSSEMADAMYDLIAYNHEHIVSGVCPKEHVEIYARAFEGIAKQYASILLASGVIDTIYPQYKDEEKNRNKNIGIWDDQDLYEKSKKKGEEGELDLFTNIVKNTTTLKGTKHTRVELKNLDYFGIQEEVTKRAPTARKYNPEVETLTTREKLAMRIAIDYASKNTDDTIVEKYFKRGLISGEEYSELTRPRVITPQVPYEGSSIYETLVGMQQDSINTKLHTMQEWESFLDEKKGEIRKSNIAPEEKSRAVANIEYNMGEVGAKIAVITQMFQYYSQIGDFVQKKMIFGQIRDVYSTLKGVLSIDSTQKRQVARERNPFER